MYSNQESDCILSFPLYRQCLGISAHELGTVSDLFVNVFFKNTAVEIVVLKALVYSLLFQIITSEMKKTKILVNMFK